MMSGQTMIGRVCANGTRHRLPAVLLLGGMAACLGGSAAIADCTCRARGRDVGHGERLCLSTPAGPRFAVCGMNQNVASWIFTDEACAVSSVARPRLAADNTRPAL